MRAICPLARPKMPLLRMGDSFILKCSSGFCLSSQDAILFAPCICASMKGVCRRQFVPPEVALFTDKAVPRYGNINAMGSLTFVLEMPQTAIAVESDRSATHPTI